MKQITDKNGKALHKGTVVRYKEGWVQVQSVCKTRQTVNIGGIFTDKIYEKDVPVHAVYEDHEAWYEQWTKSETYQSM